MKTLSTKRILVITTSAVLSVALLGGVALAGFVSPMTPAQLATVAPGAIEMAAAHLGIGRGGEMLDAALTYIGITREQYIAGVQAGKSLAQLATENGKTRDGLIAAMVAAGTAAIDAAKAQLPTMAGQMADSTGFGPKGPGFGFERGFHIGGPTIETAATYLGISVTDLHTRLQAGETLAAIANATAGKSRDGLVAAIADALKAAGVTTDVDAKAAAFVDQAHPVKVPGFGPGGFGRRGR